MKKRIVVGLMLIILVSVVSFLFTRDLINSSQSVSDSNDLSKKNSTKDNIRTIEIRSGEDLVDNEMLAPIIEYFKLSFKATADLETTDITNLFLDPSGENAWINQSALDYLIGLRLSQSNDLRMINYDCGLTISEANDQDGQIEVVIMEDHTANFVFIPNIDSSSSGIKHTFRLEKSENGYKIVEHSKDEDYFTMIETAIKDNPDTSKEIPSMFLNQGISVVEELSLEKKAFNLDRQGIQYITAQNSYDAQAAIAYAMTWIDRNGIVRNINEYDSYDQYDGNCNNYISQCLHAGGIPMDNNGDSATQWKWHDDNVNLDESDWGRSPSWAGVDEFYTYASENTGYGMAAVVNDNVFSGSIGDVLQYGHGDMWVHSVIITEVIKDQNGNMLDYLVNSNTTDRINYPADAYGYPRLRLIKIIGWNEE